MKNLFTNKMLWHGVLVTLLLATLINAHSYQEKVATVQVAGVSHGQKQQNQHQQQTHLQDLNVAAVKHESTDINSGNGFEEHVTKNIGKSGGVKLVVTTPHTTLKPANTLYYTYPAKDIQSRQRQLTPTTYTPESRNHYQGYRRYPYSGGFPSYPNEYPSYPDYFGSPGYPDNAGYTGFPGNLGYPGNSGYPGSPGYPGGFPGNPGYPGSPGYPGGYPGNPGYPGGQIYPGFPGYTGYPGFSGNPGYFTWPYIRSTDESNNFEDTENPQAFDFYPNDPAAAQHFNPTFAGFQGRFMSNKKTSGESRVSNAGLFSSRVPLYQLLQLASRTQ